MPSWTISGTQEQQQDQNKKQHKKLNDTAYMIRDKQSHILSINPENTFEKI